MSQIIYFAGSSSKTSINRELAKYTAKRLGGDNIMGLDLNDYEAPLFSVDRENQGIPGVITDFLKVIRESDVIVLSLAEHNSNFTVAFKNIIDWCSRVDRHFWSDKTIFLLSTSPGKRGGQSVLELGKKIITRMGGRVKAEFSLPKFRDNFSLEDGILDEELKKSYEEEVDKFIKIISIDK